jgi:uncharacterized protein (TIGR03067 family)
VPAALVVSTTRAARLFAAGTAAADGTIPAPVAALTEGVVKTMSLSRLKVVAVVLAVCLLGAGGWLASRSTAEPAATPKPVVAPDRPGARDDREALQGIWRVIAQETEGENDFDPRANKVTRWVFKKDQLLIKTDVGGEQTRTCAYTLDPTRTPKTLDVTAQDPDTGKTKTFRRAIYSLDGDVLKVCYRLLPAEIKRRDQDVNRRPRPFDLGDFLMPRPTELVTRAGSKTSRLTLKREAADRKDRPVERP